MHLEERSGRTGRQLRDAARAGDLQMVSSINRSDRLVTVFGGSGFVGRHVVRALARRGWRIRVATRRPDLAGHLQPLGKVGQIHAVQANVRYPASVLAAARGSQARAMAISNSRRLP